MNVTVPRTCMNAICGNWASRSKVIRQNVVLPEGTRS